MMLNQEVQGADPGEPKVLRFLVPYRRGDFMAMKRARWEKHVPIPSPCPICSRLSIYN